MIWYEKTYKKISKEEYKKLTEGMSELEILVADRFYKTLKPELTEGFRNFDGGILEYIREQEKILKLEYTEDYYDYFMEDGYGLNIMGSTETIEAFKRAFDKNNFAENIN